MTRPRYYDLNLDEWVWIDDPGPPINEPQPEPDPKLEEARLLWEEYEAYRRRTSRQ